MPRLDPAELRAFAARDWGRFDRATRSARAAATVAERVSLAIALYEAAKVTKPGWPSDADRREDLAHHQRLRALLDRAPNVGRR